ncbi:MAG: hypothetical protein UX98_C0003G0035, partial [Parcubacteria group bacterium GW2011_GWA2_47_26]
LLETQITDDSGKYAFLVGRSKYYITLEKQGYLHYRSTILDLTPPRASQIVKLEVGMGRVAI